MTRSGLATVRHDEASSLWAARPDEVMANPALDGTLDCDVVVVGAGFTGLRAAHRLAAAGTNTVVLDAGDVGTGASGRNGGQVNPILPFNGPEAVRAHVGDACFERLAAASLGSADALFDFIEKHQIDCQPRQNGWLRVDHCERAKAVSRRNAEAWRAHGADIAYFDGAELQALTGSPAYTSGILAARGGAVQPLALARGIARTAKAAGARIFGRSPALKLVQRPDGWTVETPSGSVRSKWVVLATNGYTDGLLQGLKASLIPFVSVQIATPRLAPDVIGSILPQGQTLSDTRRVIVYTRREPDDRIVIGSHGNLRRGGRLTGFRWLEREAVRIFPQLEGVEWEFAWGGRLAITHDRLPHFHEPAKGLVTGMGYNGRGVAMANVMGTVLADRVLGAAPETLPFPVSPVRKVPFREVQLIGKSTAVWWMQLLDRMETATARRAGPASH